MPTSIRWEGDEQVARNMRQYGDSVRQAMFQLGQRWTAQFEAEAKSEAPWTDRTANARQTLHAYPEWIERNALALYLSHGVAYGIYLETRNAGQYGIVLNVLERHYQRVMGSYRALFR